MRWFEVGEVVVGAAVLAVCVAGLAVSFVREWRSGMPGWARRRRR